MPEKFTGEAKKISDRDEEWWKTANKGDPKAVVPFYASNGTIVWPGESAAHGTAEITATLTKLFADYKNLELHFYPERIDVAQAGDMASDFGKVSFAYDDPKKGRVLETSKYVVVWQKVNGVWVVLYDCYNADE
jgi:ketosteroid isomerase-like protein